MMFCLSKQVAHDFYILKAAVFAYTGCMLKLMNPNSFSCVCTHPDKT